MQDFFSYLLSVVGDSTPAGKFAEDVIGLSKIVSVWGEGAGTYRAITGFNQYCATREAAWFYLRTKHPSLLRAFEQAADQYASEVNPNWKKTRELKLEDFYL